LARLSGLKAEAIRTTFFYFFPAICPYLTNRHANVGCKNGNFLNFSDQIRLPKKEGKKMTQQIFSPDYYDCYEYHGNTTIELTRKQGEMTLWRDWITFDTVEEAAVYYNEHCSACEYLGS
jgi:hypothetical protein